jgi:hypothetical protein
VLFFCIIGSKDLILVNRAAAYEASVMLLVFLFLVLFFSHFTSADRGAVFLAAGAGSIGTFLLLRGFDRYLNTDVPSAPDGLRRRSLVWGLVAYLLWQFSLVALVLPLGAFALSAIVLAAVVIAFECAIDYVRGSLDRRRLIGSGAVFAVLEFAILMTSRWGL